MPSENRSAGFVVHYMPYCRTRHRAGRRGCIVGWAVGWASAHHSRHPINPTNSYRPRQSRHFGNRVRRTFLSAPTLGFPMPSDAGLHLSVWVETAGLVEMVNWWAEAHLTAHPTI
ncbi:TPA: hypothetical protein ACFNM0_002014 [Neisseria lactamica]